MTDSLTVSPELLARAAEEAAGTLFITDLQHRLVWANGAFEQMLGYTLRDVRGHSPEFFVLDPELTFSRHIIPALDRGERVATSMEFRRSDASTFWVALAITPLRDGNGGTIGFLSNCIDITEQRQLERLATRRQRLEAIGTLAGGIAHDLNNALSPVVMGMSILREAAPQEAILLDMIETSTRRAALMVRQLLAFARGADGERRAINVALVIREVEQLVRTTFPKNIALSVDLGPSLPAVQGDATQLHQVLVNLAVNARDAMPEGGVLAIGAQLVEVSAEEASYVSLAAARPGWHLRLTVRDSGDGIAPDLVERIFDPFFTTKGPEHGTGLGLSTVLGIVKGHGGFVHVDSRVGIGSAFHVYLPVAEAAAPPEPVPAAAGEHEATGLLLFVDDEPYIRSLAMVLARRIGCEAITAASADEALVILGRSAHRVTAVVTDLHMPGRDGLALVREVRERWPALPVTIVTGLLTDDLWRAVRGVPHLTVLPKPFSEQQLRQVLRGEAGGVPAAEA